ncbi:hypothetical protein B0H10DRAFT_1970004 [Mycena sp. CBHHK59/15]|nr:hypothetical protein B0H10DRAFT_1970004 [Mycena sp. CBHHK59/15]
MTWIGNKLNNDRKFKRLGSTTKIVEVVPGYLSGSKSVDMAQHLSKLGELYPLKTECTSMCANIQPLQGSLYPGKSSVIHIANRALEVLGDLYNSTDLEKDTYGKGPRAKSPDVTQNHLAPFKCILGANTTGSHEKRKG